MYGRYSLVVDRDEASVLRNMTLLKFSLLARPANASCAKWVIPRTKITQNTTDDIRNCSFVKTMNWIDWKEFMTVMSGEHDELTMFVFDAFEFAFSHSGPDLCVLICCHSQFQQRPQRVATRCLRTSWADLTGCWQAGSNKQTKFLLTKTFFWTYSLIHTDQELQCRWTDRVIVYLSTARSSEAKFGKIAL